MKINTINNGYTNYTNFYGIKKKHSQENKEETKSTEDKPLTNIKWKIAETFFNFTQKDSIQIKLADHIEFQPAKNINEAKKFARKNLGICTYKITDVDCANYVNEALCNYYNNSKNKNSVIDSCDITNAPLAIAAIKPATSCLVINQEKMKNIDAEIENLFNGKKEKAIQPDGLFEKRYNLTEKQREYIEKYRTNPDQMSLKEKIGFEMFIQDSLDPLAMQTTFDDMAQNPNVIEYLNKRGFSDFKEITKLPKEIFKQLVRDIFENTDYRINTHDGGDFLPINHEIGHKMHAKNVGLKRFYELSTFVHTENKEETTINEINSMKKFIQNEPQWRLVRNVSPYSAVSPAEFVAETFAHLVNGAEFDDATIELYKKYGGVMP